MEKIFNRHSSSSFGLILFSLLFAVTACGTLMEATTEGISSAVGSAVESEVERSVTNIIANYSDAMLYELAYTRAFLVGGYSVEMEDFVEGEGSIWQVSVDGEGQTHRYTVERALLKNNEDGSSWWYFRYQPDEDDAIEYEMKLTESFSPLEMYVKDPETGNVEHRVLTTREQQQGSRANEDADLEGNRDIKDRFEIENWEDYREGEEVMQIGENTFNATILLYEGSEEEGDEGMSVRWWLADDVPGELLKYEMTDENEGYRASGEMINLKRDYIPKFVEM